MRTGSFEEWREIATSSERLAAEDPMAGVIVSLYAMAAWQGGVGNDLFLQPWTGHHPGWHVFPLSLARNLVAADAVWTAGWVARTAKEFVESAKDAHWNDTLQRVITTYQQVMARVETRVRDSVANLAWDLYNAARQDEPNFRAELAALFWTAGDVPHANLIAFDGSPAYRPPRPVVEDLVDLTMRRIEDDPFAQYLWLEMKDRPPFNLRSHKVLFGRINTVYRSSPVHELEMLGLFSPSRAYAKAAIGYFGKSLSAEARANLREALGLFKEMVGMRAPVAFLRLGALYNLTLTEDEQARMARWRELASMATFILEGAVRQGVFEPLDHSLEVPFNYLDTGSDVTMNEMIRTLERYRTAGLTYWLAVVPPMLPPRGQEIHSLLKEEEDVLRELRGARFIRLLPYLPKHYRRYGVEVREAMEMELPEGVAKKEGHLLPFDPFDQELAVREMRESWERLEGLWERMAAVAPGYAAQRKEPSADIDEFAEALGPGWNLGAG
ncbi:MAG: hypothetical protein ACT4P5_08320 [Armatimonadota bacterium]